MKWKKSALTIGTAASLLLGTLPGVTLAKTNDNVVISQGNGAGILSNANYFGDMDPNSVVTVDIVMKIQNKDDLARYISDTSNKNSTHYRQYLDVSQFKAKYAPTPTQIQTVTQYLKSFGIKSTVYQDNLIITATGTVAQFNKAFNVEIQRASFNGKSFHATKKNPNAPANVAENILCILGLSDYSNFTTNSVKRSNTIAPSDNTSPQGPLSLTPQDLMKQYNVNPLYASGANGAGQTIGIVSLADFNVEDAYAFWDQMGIKVKANRVEKINVDGGTGWDGYDETTLDIQQSGALAPQADMKAYLAPNSDTGFVDGFAKAINDNKVQSLSVSWGLSETILQIGVQENWETPEYAESFNQLYMEAAAQGISMFAAAGDAGAYDTGSDGIYDLSVDNPADSPYITAAGGTTLPFHFTSPSTGITVAVDKERAWGWDYLGEYFKARHLPLEYLVVGGGGGFSALYPTPDYQKGVSGINSFSAVQDFKISKDLLQLIGFNSKQTVIHGTGSGRNMPDLSMNADPYTGYYVYLSDPGKPGENSGFDVYGGTSFVSPQLNGLTALINNANHTQVGFWNPQIYLYAQEKDSPLHPLNDAGAANDNGYYTGTPGTVYNQATGLGTPDVAKLAQKFGK
jgi:kumamolisin